MPRLFTAIELPGNICDRALELVEQLRPAAPTFKWTPRENLHITLKFIGEVEEGRVAAVRQAVASAAGECAPFEFELAGVGAFPQARRPNIVWLGVRGGSERVEKLFRAIQRRLVPLGIPREQRKFAPHLTLGRQKRGAGPVPALGTLLAAQADFSAGALWAREVVLFESRLLPAGPEYLVLERAPLAVAAAE